MLSFHDSLKIFAYAHPTDMRKGFNGLCGISQEELGVDPTDGSRFVFINRRCDRMIQYRSQQAGLVPACPWTTWFGNGVRPQSGPPEHSVRSLR